MITVVDYGCGNIAAIVNMLGRLGQTAKIARTPKELEDASSIILPGVGAFDEGMKQLRDRKMRDVLDAKVLEAKVPLLGICLGAQLICRKSEEGSEPGLAWVQADVVKFDQANLSEWDRIPNMGWHNVDYQSSEQLFAGYEDDPRFYFVHSYHIVCDSDVDVIATAVHGRPFPAAVKNANVIGVQFHPEKSHRYGLQLFQNFLNYYSAGLDEKS